MGDALGIRHTCVFFNTAILRFCDFFLGLDHRGWINIKENCFFVNCIVFVCLFKRQRSIPNKITIIWNAFLSLKQANNHSKVDKQIIFSYIYPTHRICDPTLNLNLTKVSTQKKNRKIAKSRNRKIAKKKRKCGGCLKQRYCSC